MVHWFSKTDLGTKRENNEDYALGLPSLGLWVLADGVGGNQAGEVASQMACESIAEQVKNGSDLPVAIQAAHEKIQKSPKAGVGLLGMATTVVAARVRDGQYQIAWVGDSRAYLLRQSGGITLLTKDHSFVNQLIGIGHLTEEQSLTHPLRNIITQAVGQEDLAQVAVDSLTGTLQSGDILLLCSDGLSDSLSDAQIAGAFVADLELEVVAVHLIQLALEKESHDNVTVLLIQQQGYGGTNAGHEIPTRANVGMFFRRFPWIGIVVPLLLLLWFVMIGN